MLSFNSPVTLPRLIENVNAKLIKNVPGFPMADNLNRKAEFAGALPFSSELPDKPAIRVELENRLGFPVQDEQVAIIVLGNGYGIVKIDILTFLFLTRKTSPQIQFNCVAACR